MTFLSGNIGFSQIHTHNDNAYIGSVYNSTAMYKAGLPHFPWYNIPKREKIHQTTITNSKLLQNIPNGSEIYQNFPLQNITK
jgi:hypothetical protein